jgi:hypothetical protein
VPAGTRHFQGALGGLLPVDIAHIDGVLGRLGKQKLRIHADRLERLWRIDKVDGLRQGLYGEDVHALNHRSFPRVGFWDRNGLEAHFTGGERRRQCASDGTHTAIQRKFSQEHALVQSLAEEVPHASG